MDGQEVVAGEKEREGNVAQSSSKHHVRVKCSISTDTGSLKSRSALTLIVQLSFWSENVWVLWNWSIEIKTKWFRIWWWGREIGDENQERSKGLDKTVFKKIIILFVFKNSMEIKFQLDLGLSVTFKTKCEHLRIFPIFDKNEIFRKK